MTSTNQKKELFIVEGKSARSAVKLAVDNKSQSVYSVQGKLANVSNISHAAVVDNLECQQLFTQLGGDFSGEYQLNALPYSQVLILMDPDADGSHSRALALTFFARYCKPMIAEGLLSVIKPPMFRIRIGSAKPVYAWSEKELQQLLSDDSKRSAQTTRFKGVAQFSVEECHQFLLSPATRRQAVLTLS